MTRGELSALEVLLGEFRQFRKSDDQWKTDIDGRLRMVEGFISGERAKAAAGISRRARLGIAVSAIGVAGSCLLGVANLLR